MLSQYLNVCLCNSRVAVNQEYHTYIDYLIILKIILINDMQIFASL